MPIIPVSWEAEIGKIMVQGQPEQNFSKILSISTNMVGMVAHICNPSNEGGISRSALGK
jgi:hypothetical protein